MKHCTFCNTDYEKDHEIECPSCGGHYHIDANQCATCGATNLILEVIHADEHSNVGRGSRAGHAYTEVLSDTPEKHDAGEVEAIPELSEISDAGNQSDSEGTPEPSRTKRRR